MPPTSAGLIVLHLRQLIVGAGFYETERSIGRLRRCRGFTHTAAVVQRAFKDAWCSKGTGAQVSRWLRGKGSPATKNATLERRERGIQELRERAAEHLTSVVQGTGSRDAAWLQELPDKGSFRWDSASQRQETPVIDSVRVYAENQIPHTRRRPHKVTGVWQVTVLAQPGTRLNVIVRGKVEVLLFETAVKTNLHYRRDSAECQYLGHMVLLKTCQVDGPSGVGLNCPREECHPQTAVD
ncbi:hypothetical protein K456DRAFT_1936315 [Colletotrichum gloeosporioides 23]|nr:hypothetical protein K456DRAFT_1936315 [Colletotrichum gloeosporioides 23]